LPAARRSTCTKLHALADRGLRADPRADVLFPLTEAVVQGLTGGWAAIVLDGAQRIVQWGEARSQLAAWEKAEPQLTGDPDRAVARAPTVERPRPKPDGPVERYVGQALAAGAAAGAAAWPVRVASGRCLASPRSGAPAPDVRVCRSTRLDAGRAVSSRWTGSAQLDRIDTWCWTPPCSGSDRGC
jgi:hypothetical protein